MNVFGRQLKVEIFGESHGSCVGVVLEGCPAGLELSEEDFAQDLGRRRGGGEKGTTPRREDDCPRLESGLLDAKTTGAPLLVLFDNKNADSKPYDELRNKPRPGHADWVAYQKYGGHADHRGGGHFSGRLTVGLVAAGVIAKKLIRPVAVEARVVHVAGRADIEQVVAEALAEGDSVGGVVECRARGLPSGLGEPFFDSMESLISHAAFSIPAVKAIEFGAGFEGTRMRGSQFNDEIVDSKGTTATNHAGGINGGITNGNDLVFRVAVRPTSSIAKKQRTVDLRTGEPAEVVVEGRHDACIALRVPVVLEAITALVVADVMLLERRIPRVLRSAAPGGGVVQQG